MTCDAGAVGDKDLVVSADQVNTGLSVHPSLGIMEEQC